MLIKITGIEDGLLGTFDAKVVTGTRLDDGADVEKKFFANNRKLGEELSAFGVGDNLNIKMQQNGKYWDIIGFDAPSEAMVEKVMANGGGYKNKPAAAGGQAKAKAQGDGSSSTMTKAEWAEKDRKAKIGMSIHNAIAAASRLCKVGTTPEKVTEYATKLLPFLMLQELPGEGDKGNDEDPLVPPAVG